MGGYDRSLGHEAEECVNELSPALELLWADGQIPEAHDRLMGFGRFVGSWDIEASWYQADGSEDQQSCHMSRSSSVRARDLD
jgi:hypothetical protein